MLFNSIDQLKEITGFLYAYNSFDNIKTDIELAEEDMKELIGAATFALADNHVNGVDPPESALLDEMVKHIRLPVAYYAIHSFSQNTDVSHEDTGRKVKIDSEREKLPWQWMLERDERAILRKAHRTTDRLIGWLDDNIADATLEPWKDSDERKAIRGQMISDAITFDTIYPIDKSRRFFLKISPFIREAERKYILPALTSTTFADIKTALRSVPQGDIEPEGVLPYIQVPLAYFSMAIAVERLNLTVLPEGVVQQFESERLTQNATQPVSMEDKKLYAKHLTDRAQAELFHLHEFLRKDSEGDSYTDRDLTQGLNEENKFARI